MGAKKKAAKKSAKKAAARSGGSPFGPGLVTFLTELRANNKRSWFQDNAERYESDVREPAFAFIREFRGPLAKVSKHFVAEDRKVGGALMRIHRDVRFSKDKSPYKTAVGGLLTPTGDKRDNAGVAYLHLADGGGFLACGHHQLSPARLAPVRDKIIERAAEFTAVVDGLADRHRALSDDDSLRAMPRGYSEYAGHEHAEHLRRRSFMVMQNVTQKDWISGDVVAKAAALIADSAELVAFVARADRG